MLVLSVAGHWPPTGLVQLRVLSLSFFFQAEDGIRDSSVTGVQTCALPIFLDALATIAPVTAIRGNIDRDPWAKRLHETEIVEIEDSILYVIHDLNQLDLDQIGRASCRERV